MIIRLCSADPGFESLSPSRRASLMKLIERANEHYAMAVFLLEAMVKTNGFSAEMIGVAERVRNRYPDLVSLVELQFPEVRADRRGKFSHLDAHTNRELNGWLQDIDFALADASGTDRVELRCWLDCVHEAMPRPLPLMVRVTT